VPTFRETPFAPRAPPFVQPAALLEAVADCVLAGVLLELGAEEELLEGVSLCSGGGA